MVILTNLIQNIKFFNTKSINGYSTKNPQTHFQFFHSDKDNVEQHPRLSKLRSILNTLWISKNSALGHLKNILKKSRNELVQISIQPELKPVKVIEYLSWDEKAFAKECPVVQIQEVVTREIKNVYEEQLKYSWESGLVFLLESGDRL